MKRMIPWIGLVLLVAAVPVLAADWTHWRGPEQTGVARDTGLPEKWAYQKPGENHLIWSQPYGGRSTPVVSRGKVYIINGSGARINEQERVMCFDAKTGKLEWEYKFNVFLCDIVTNRVGWANLAADPETGNIYAHGVQGLFFCFAPDGKVLWSRSLTEEYGRITGYGGRITSPIIDEDKVLIHFLNASWGDQGRGGHRFLALDKKTGEVIWWSEPGGQPLDTIQSGMTVAVINGERLLICGGADGAVHAMQVRTGKKVWSHPLSKRGINAAPVVDGNFVYITQGEENLEPNTPNGCVFCFDAGNVKDGKPALVWRQTNIRAGYVSPIIHEGRLYVADDSAVLRCLDAKDGKLYWEHSYGRVGKASPVWADGKIYVPEVTSKFHILQPGDKECKTIHTVEFPPSPRGEVTEIYASAAVSDGRIYIVSGSGIYCIGTTEGKAGKVPEPAPEPAVDPEAKPAQLQIVPADVVLEKGGSVQFKVRMYDDRGRYLKESAAEWSLPQPTVPMGQPQPPPLKGVIDENGKLTVDAQLPRQAGYVEARVGGLTARARVRVAPPLPFSMDFEDMPAGAGGVNGWVNVQGKFVVAELQEGGKPNKVLKKLANSPNPLLARAYAYITTPDKKDYTIEADVLGKEVRGQLPNMGVLNCRYTLWMDGNKQRLWLSSWEANHRIEKKLDFEVKPDVWYRFKLKVTVENEQAICLGKAWPRDQKEPDEWMLELKDPVPNREGSPGIYAYTFGAIQDDDGKILPGTEVFFDNIKVTPNQGRR